MVYRAGKICTAAGCCLPLCQADQWLERALLQGREGAPVNSAGWEGSWGMSQERCPTCRWLVFVVYLFNQFLLDMSTQRVSDWSAT